MMYESVLDRAKREQREVIRDQYGTFLNRMRSGRLAWTNAQLLDETRQALAVIFQWQRDRTRRIHPKDVCARTLWDLCRDHRRAIAVVRIIGLYEAWMAVNVFGRVVPPKATVPWKWLRALRRWAVPIHAQGWINPDGGRVFHDLDPRKFPLEFAEQCITVLEFAPDGNQRAFHRRA